MTKDEARAEWAVERALRFGLRGVAVGIAGGLGLSLPMLMVGATLSAVAGLTAGLAVLGYLVWFVVGLVAREGVGSLFDIVTQGPRGRTRSEYSHTQALVARGAYPEAVTEYREAADANPLDPQPLLMGARVLRDHLGDAEQAAAWLRRAAALDPIEREAEAAVVRELVSLYTGPLQQPRNALPLLARMAERHAGTRPGQWAAGTLARMRTHAWEGVRDDGHEPVTDYQGQVLGRRPDPQARPTRRPDTEA